MEDQLRISGSIVLYNNSDDVVTVIQDFLQTPLPLTLFLVDNSPTNALQITLQHWITDERVEYIFNNSNVGYGAGHNVAIRKSLAGNYSYHFVFNPDIRFSPDVIPQIIQYMNSHLDVGLVMPKILYENGDTQYLCKLLPTPYDLFGRRFLPIGFTKTRTTTFGLRDTGYDKMMEVPFLSGCFMALRKEAIEQCGMFDERFFMYGEDIDFSRRIHQKFKTIFYPRVSVIHGYEAASYKQFHTLKIHAINIIRYFNKWGWIFDKERRKINEETLKKLR